MKTKFVQLTDRDGKALLYVMTGDSSFFFLFVCLEEKLLGYFVLEFHSTDQLMLRLNTTDTKPFFKYVNCPYDEVLDIVVENSIVRFTLLYQRDSENVSFQIDTDTSIDFSEFTTYSPYPKALEVLNQEKGMRFSLHQHNTKEMWLDVLEQGMIDDLGILLYER